MLFRQFADPVSHTYTYLLASAPGREAVLIDPVRDRVEHYVRAIEELGLRLVKAIDTHTHADHITGLGLLRVQTGCATVMGQYTKADCVAVRVGDGEVIDTDGVKLKALYTPGHTDESFSFVLNPDTPRAVFSGDALLIRGTGRTDFQNGDPGASWDSITQKLFALPDATLLYPGHDYKGWTCSSIGEERRHNPRLAGKSRDEYIEIMNRLDLPHPELMDVAVPANLHCGLDHPH